MGAGGGGGENWARCAASAACLASSCLDASA
jgi:hypothetical protein